MVAGHLHEKNGYYYIILNLTDSAGKRKPKWISTGLTIKGNKKRAEQMLMEERRKYANAKTGDDVLFADFMEQWLEIVKSTVSIPTYSVCKCCEVNYCTILPKEENTLTGFAGT